MFTVAALTLGGLSADEAVVLGKLVEVLSARLPRNLRRERYYRGKERVKQLGIAVPTAIAADLDTVVGWPEIAVDVLEERLDLEGFLHETVDLDALGLPEIIRQNHWLTEASPAHIDSLVYGVVFGTASVGDSAKGEPDPLVTWEPPTRMTGEWNARQRRFTAAVAIKWDDHGQPKAATLLLPEQNIICERKGGGGQWRVVDRQEHDLGFVTAVAAVNRPRTSRPWGSSEITRAIMSYTDTAVRTVLGMEVNREFYSSPQRYALGVGDEAFTDADGYPIPAWEAVLGRLWTLTSDQNGKNPEVGQFTPASPAPYLEQIKGVGSMFSASAGIPVSYLGFHTQNPPGGDGIRASESRLVKRAERRQSTLDRAHSRLCAIALHLKNLGDVPDLSGITTLWRDAATPTRAATADAIVKQVAAGILPADSDVTLRLLGYDAATRSELAQDRRRARARETVAALRVAATSTTPSAVESLDRSGDLNAGR